jgi:hypothetical protein
MSLVSAWDGINAGCVAVPQHGYNSVEPDQRYMLTYSHGANRTFYRFPEPVRLVFTCPSPPHTFGAYFHEKPPGESSLDPILSIFGYLSACGSPGTWLGTSLWFDMAYILLTWKDGSVYSPRWVHLMNLNTSVGSIGIKYYYETPA